MAGIPLPPGGRNFSEVSLRAWADNLRLSIKTAFSELDDVTITSLADNDLLIASDNQWVNSSITDIEPLIDHDNLANYVANQHIDWTNALVDFKTLGNGDFFGSEALRIPVGTTGQRPDIPTDGDMRLNSTLSRVEIYKGSAWVSLEGEEAVRRSWMGF